MFDYQLFARCLKGEVPEVLEAPKQKEFQAAEPMLAPRPFPTRATVGKYSASID